MVKKKNTSVKSTEKAPLKTQRTNAKTRKSFEVSDCKVESASNSPAAAAAKVASVKSTSAQNKTAANSERRGTATERSPGTAKSASRGNTSSRAKIAAAASRRSISTASPTVEDRAVATPKGNVKNVAATVAKSAAKQSTPVAEAKTSKIQQCSDEQHSFKSGEYIVYPAHGVGRIIDMEEQEIAGLSLELFVITFEKDKMTLRVPTDKFKNVGMRKLSEPRIVEKAMKTLKGRARIKRTMWSRRAQEYEAKINSGDLISVAEVVRDLYRSDNQPEQSYSERQLYEQALDRMAREIAVIEQLDDRGAVQRITEILAKSAKGRLEAEQSVETGEEVASDVEAA